MKILLTCDPELPVPPGLYGGVERLVDGLAKGYQKQGHEVYLVANAASRCAYTQINYKWPAMYSRGFKNIWRNMMFLSKVADKVKPDVVHSFSRLLYGYPLFLATKIPFIQTYGRKISARATAFAIRLAGGKLHFTSCAAHMLKGLPNQQFFTPVFNFTNVDYFAFDDTVERTYVMFLGRIENIKGTKEAIDAAIQSNTEIIIAGNVEPKHYRYFDGQIKPLMAHPLVQYVGAVNDEQKKYYLQRAKALLFPVKWEEPFGIVLAEALACGTPVIAFNRGSVPEVIQEGANGYIVADVNEMAIAINKIDKLNNKEIRREARTKFSLENITGQYLSLFDNMVG